MDIYLSDIRYMRAIAEVENISKAAERLGLRQSTLSESLKRLEAAVNTRLFIRSKKGVVLTKEGERFLHSAIDLETRWHELRSSIRESREKFHGPLTIGCHQVPAAYFLPRILTSLKKHFPDLKIRLVHDSSERLNDLVDEGEVDYAISAVPVAHKDLAAQSLGDDFVGFWQKKGKKFDASEATLLLVPDYWQGRLLMEKLQRAGVHFKSTLHSTSFEVCMALASHGYGVAVLPRRSMLAASDLELNENLPSLSARFQLVFNPQRQSSPLLKTVTKAIRAAALEEN